MQAHYWYVLLWLNVFQRKPKIRQRFILLLKICSWLPVVGALVDAVPSGGCVRLSHPMVKLQLCSTGSLFLEDSASDVWPLSICSSEEFASGVCGLSRNKVFGAYKSQPSSSKRATTELLIVAPSRLQDMSFIVEHLDAHLSLFKL